MRMKIGQTIAFAVLIWVIGFMWGTVVFMTPALKDIPSLPMLSRYPAITFPLLPLFPWLAYVFARSAWREERNPMRACRRWDLYLPG